MSADLTALLSGIAGRGRVEDADILALRQAIFGEDVAVSPAEAEGLLALNDKIDGNNPAWASLYVEALTDYVVNQAEPAGFVDQKTADWLVARLMRDGRLKSATELELLVHILETAREAPASLNSFALTQIRDGILRADANLLESQARHPGMISTDEIALLRRVLYAAASGGNVAITREEADLLFDLKDAVAGKANDPAWSDLFVKAVASHLMFASLPQPASRDEILREEAWLDTPDEGLFGFLSRGLKSLGGFGSSMAMARAPAPDDMTDDLVAASERISPAEAQWLAGRLDRDGKLDEAERALLAFIRENASAIDPSLAPFIARI